MSLRLKALQAEDRPRFPAAIPEWGFDAFVQTLTAADYDDYESWAFQKGDGSNYRAKLVCRALVDAQGQRVFTDEDATAVGHKSAAVVGRLFDVVAQHNRTSIEDLEQLRKNCEAGPSAGSPSA